MKGRNISNKIYATFADFIFNFKYIHAVMSDDRMVLPWYMFAKDFSKLLILIYLANGMYSEAEVALSLSLLGLYDSIAVCAGILNDYYCWEHYKNISVAFSSIVCCYTVLAGGARKTFYKWHYLFGFLFFVEFCSVFSILCTPKLYKIRKMHNSNTS